MPDSSPDRRTGQNRPIRAAEPPVHPSHNRVPHADEEANVDRRTGLDRRLLAALEEIAAEELQDTDDDETGLARRRGPGRRRTDFTKSAEEGEMTPEQFMFVMAIDAFKKANGRMYPTWTDVLEVVRLLGYRKTMASELNIRNAEDWTERPDATSGVRSKPGHPELPAEQPERKRKAA